MCHVPLAPQVPQFMLEAGYGSKQFPERRGTVGVTQPRRVAAVSTATRVAQELGEELGRTVGYQVGGGAWAHCGVSGGRRSLGALWGIRWASHLITCIPCL